ncbi:hypothetical protein JHK86_025964 [Glycine max]|nr:hypothetical protein JHK86_025964 [Glycine max]
MSAEYVSSVVDLMVLKGRPNPIYGGPAGAIPFVSFYGRFRDSEGEDWVVVPILLPHHVMKKFLFELVKITVRSL